MDVLIIVFVPFFMGGTPANCAGEEYLLKSRVESLNMQLADPRVTPFHARQLRKAYEMDYKRAKESAEACVARLELIKKMNDKARAEAAPAYRRD